MHRGVRAGVLGLAVSAACTPTTPGGYPDVTGTWGSPQMWDTRFTLPGDVVVFSKCGGSITVEHQDDQFLSGRFAVIGGLCETVRGQVVGEMERAGNVTFDMHTEAGFQTFAGCGYVAGERLWTGRFAGKGLAARIDLTLDCNNVNGRPARLRAEANAVGELLPGSR